MAEDGWTVDMMTAKISVGKRVLAHLEGFSDGHISFGTGHWTHADVLEALPNDQFRVKLLVTPLGVTEAVVPRDHLKSVPGQIYD